MVQLKGNFTHADRAHTTYWPKARSYIHQPILACAVRKTCQHYFCKRQECRLRGHYSRYSHGYIYTFPSVIMYIYIILCSHLASFLHSILCATAACITIPCLDIDTSSRVVFSWLLLKSAGYSASQIKNRHQQSILIASTFSYQLPSN